MRWHKRIFSLLVVLCLYIPAFTQEDSCDLRISMLTCGPGDDLYSIFGHSGIRVTERNTQRDIVYNYGTFDFDDGFYVKFVLGGDRLQYFVAPEKFEDFIYGYQLENRSIKEQVLQLNCEEKRQLYRALQVNSLKANRYYRYDFLFDNCSTRVRDIIAANMGQGLGFRNILPPTRLTFRNMIHEYLNAGKQYWSKMGIDLLLGSRMDVQVSNLQAMFLPDYLMKGFDSASVGSTPIVQSKKLIQPAYNKKDENYWFYPETLTIFLLVVFGSMSFVKKRWAYAVLNVFDIFFFFLLGALGFLLLFMWFGTDHALCANNYNLLWALPFHLPVSFVLLKKKQFTRQYFGFCAVFYLLLLFAWEILPQGMHPAFLPLAILACMRSYDRYKKYRRHD